MFSTKFQQSTLKFAVAAAVAMSAASAHAAQATASASGTVIAPIAVAKATDLAFGSFAPGAGGTVTVSTSGARTTTGPVLFAGAAGAAARFNVTGEANSNYSISLSGSAALTSGPNSMALSHISDLTAANSVSGTVSSGTLDGAGTQSLYVGGTLAVSPTQAPGVYTGSVVATVEYN